MALESGYWPERWPLLLTLHGAVCRKAGTKETVFRPPLLALCCLWFPPTQLVREDPEITLLCPLPTSPFHLQCLSLSMVNVDIDCQWCLIFWFHLWWKGQLCFTQWLSLIGIWIWFPELTVISRTLCTRICDSLNLCSFLEFLRLSALAW